MTMKKIEPIKNALNGDQLVEKFNELVQRVNELSTLSELVATRNPQQTRDIGRSV